jgi:hypothetical protein
MTKKKKKNEIPYREAVISFIDILGFRELVANSPDASSIRRILSRLRNFTSPVKIDLDAGAPDAQSIAFSDSIVRVRFYDVEYATGAVFQEVHGLLLAQSELAAENVLLRGGMTVGRVHLEGDMAFGPGFTRAYDLESQFANFPRIILGPEVFAALRADPRLVAEHHDIEDDVYYLRKFLERGDDGFWFVDYLYSIADEMDKPENFQDLLASHRNFAIAGANAAPTHSRVLQKFLWLARYIDGVSKRRGYSDLRISQKDISALEELSETPDWASAEHSIRIDDL